MLIHAIAAGQMAAGTAPPGSEKFTKIVEWALWSCSTRCGVAFMISGDADLSIRRGESGQHMSQLGAAAAGTVIVGVASTIVTQLI
jgi:hypothetical protein